jgi:hypothetical protein
MTIPLTGTGGLFTRLGAMFGIFRLINTFRGSTIPPKVNALQSQFDTTDQFLADNLYSNLLSFQNSSTGYQQSLRSLATSTVIQMVTDDQPQSQASSLPISLNYLINQMISASATVNQCNASATVIAGSGNTGNAIVVAGLYTSTGLIQQDAFAELITGIVTADAQTGNRIAGQETFTFRGQYAIGDPLSWLYPVGSGAQVSVTCISALVNQSRGTQNYLNNGSFESWANVPNVPDGFLVQTGTPGTTIKQSTAVFYDGLSSLNFAGNGSELTSIYQQFGTISASGTTTSEFPFDHVAWNTFVQVDSTPAAGVLEFAYVNSSNVIVNDASGNPNVKTLALTGLTGGVWTSFHGFFRVPRVLPTGLRLRIRLSTALTSGRNVFIDHAALAGVVQMYPGGCVLAAFSANTNLISGDTYYANIYNDYAGKFQTDFDRMFGMKQLGLLLPSSSSPSIPDSLDS